MLGRILFSLGSILFYAFVGFANSDASLTGKITNTSSCRDQEAQVWCAQGKTLIYQVVVPTGGTFEFRLPAGSYTITAKSKSSCFAREEVDLVEGKEKKTTLKLNAIERQPAQVLNDTQRASECLCFQAAGCPCGNSGVYTAPAYIRPEWYPWWMYYGAQFPNFYYPGPWSGYGLNPTYFPGNAPVAFAKPNLYISGPQKQSVQMKISLKESNANWLASIPAYGSQGWQVRLAGNGKMESEDIKYPFLYYDFRGNSTRLQSEKGFCSSRTGTLERISRSLRSMGFEPTEVSDFEEYWRIKLPPSEDLCVFPQENKELDGIAVLEVVPHPDRVTRVVFVVVPKDAKDLQGGERFMGPPKADWTSTARRPTAKESLAVREWGVAFFFSNK